MRIRSGNKRREEEYQRALIETHYNEVENMYRKMRAWRHDYHNHMQALTAYLDAGDIAGAKAFLAEINDNLVSVDTVLKTGNRMVDAILNSKLSLMASKHIRADASARVPAELAIPGIDLCIIIGNLLDNAMEACGSLPEEARFIRVYIAPKDNHLYMSFTNAADRKRTMIGGHFPSTKGGDHGLGLSRVDALVAVYDGALTRGSEDGGFTTEVILPLS